MRKAIALIVATWVLTGASCADVPAVAFDVGAQIQTTVDRAKATIDGWKQTYEKAKAVYEILNAEPTPSAQPSAGQPQPAIEENTSSQ